MIPERLKPVVRRWIVQTSVPPLTAVYRGVYGLLIHLAGRGLSRLPGARAVYLRRGWAKGEALPGVSDIDLAAVGDWDEEQRERVRMRHRRYARLLPVLDPRLRVYSPESLRQTYLTDPFLRHRIEEGKTTWKLLGGRDCLAGLPPLTRQQVLSGYHSELSAWWLHFARRAYPAGNEPRDEIILNSICHKAAAETLRAEIALRRGTRIDSRVEVLERAPDLLPLDDSAAGFLEKLAASARGRYLRYRGDVADETQRFLLPRLESCLRRLVLEMRERPAARGAPRTDAPPAERLEAAGADSLLRELAEMASERWGRRSCYAVRGLSFAMDEVQLLLETKPDDPPAAAEIRALGAVLQRVQRGAPCRVCVHLLLPNCACQVLAPDRFLPGQAVLTPASCPEVFEMLGSRDALLLGDRLRPVEPAVWTQAAEDALYLDREAARSALASCAAGAGEKPLAFLRAFWRSLQLEAAHRRAAAGDPVRPLTPGAVSRALENCGVEVPPLLGELGRAYRAELRGEASAASALARPALAYLRSVASE